MYGEHKLGIVVPAYNEQHLIEENLKGIPRSADCIYIIDDGSTDGTQQIIEGYNKDRFYVIL